MLPVRIALSSAVHCSHFEQPTVSPDRSIAALTAPGTLAGTLALGLLLLIGP
jgi:hypothetical protein